MGVNPSPLKEAGWGLEDLLILKQVHGDRVLGLKDGKDEEKIRGQEADGLLSLTPGRPIAVKTADCVPILFAHPRGLVGAVHAGWRGSAQEVLIKALQFLEKDFNLKAGDLKMAMGPTICWDHYEVGEEVAQKFSSSRYPEVLKPVGKKFLLNLQRINLLQALEGGVLKKNIQIFSHCTFEDPDWHSYRRSLKEGKQEAGRNYSWIMWKK
jgi:YfiH family protein